MRDVTVAGMGAYASMSMITGAVEATTRPAAQFEYQLARMASKGNYTADQVRAIKEQVLSLSQTSVFGPVAATESAVELAAAGISATEMKTVLPVALKFGKSSEMGTGAATSFLADTAAQFNLGIDQYERIADVSTRAANAVTISVADVGKSFEYVAKISKESGMTIEETAALIAILGKNGLKGEKGGTAARAILTGLVRPGKQAREALAALHMTEKDLAKGLGNLPELMLKIGDIMDKKGFSQPARMRVMKGLFGTEGMTAGLTISTQSEEWARLRGETSQKQSLGETDRVIETLMNTAQGRLENNAARMEAAATRLGNSLMPLKEKVMTTLASITIGASQILGDNPAVGEALGTALGAGIAGIGGGIVAAKLASALLAAESITAITAAGATLGGTIAAALVSAVAGYAIGSKIAEMLHIDLESQGQKVIGERGLARDSGGVAGGAEMPIDPAEIQAGKLAAVAAESSARGPKTIQQIWHEMSGGDRRQKHELEIHVRTMSPGARIVTGSNPGAWAGGPT
jgi:TP901 family phage tail tape measure protein